MRRSAVTSHAAVNIAAESAVQAIGNSQSGGVQPGLRSVRYHGPGSNSTPVSAALATAAARASGVSQSDVSK